MVAETAAAEVLLTVVTSPATVVAAEAMVLIEATVEEASRAIVAAFRAIVAAEVAVVADVEEASLFLCTLDPPATASSCEFQASSRSSVRLCD